MEYRNSFIHTPVLRTEYGTLLEHQSFFMQGLHRLYLFVPLELPKEINVLINILPQPNYDNGGWMKLSHYLVTNMYSDPLKEIMHKKVCISFRRTYQELFQHIEMRKHNISFRIRNHFPAIIPTLTYQTTRLVAVKLSVQQYWYSKGGKEQKRAIIPAVLVSFVEINRLGALTVKPANLLLGYKRLKAIPQAMESLYKKNRLFHNSLKVLKITKTF